MEILIIGLILVGLMVYASTRIRRNAAEAFEPETIVTPEFSIKKPEGMLHVLNGDRRYAFEAYSRDFAPIGRRDIRVATACVQIIDAEPQHGDEEPVSLLNEVIGERHYRITESRDIREGAEFRVIRKSSDLNGRLVVLEVNALADAPQDLSKGLE